MVRVPHKSLVEIPLPPAEELALLDRVPAGLGAQPITALDGPPGSAIPAIITTRVPGRQLPAREWEGRPDLLEALARQLARLHHGGVCTGLAAPTSIDPLGEAEVAMDWWQENEPASASAGQHLCPAVRAHQEAARPAFAQIDVRFLHGDPVAANILVDADGIPRFVDWEWAQLGDVARDLAFIGGALRLEPWYARLSAGEVRDQALAYVAEREALDPGVAQHPALQIDALLARRAAFLIHEAFFTGLHLHRVGEQGDSGAAQRHLAIMAQLEQALA